MAGQNPSRREVLQAISLASIAAFAPGFRRWACAQQMQMHHDAPPSSAALTPAPGPYTPLFFKPGEFETVEQLSELILPADGDAPGAKAAGVAEFIDFWVANDSSLQQPFVQGLARLQVLSRKSGGQAFLTLNVQQQNALLTRLAYKQHFRPGEEAARAFFATLRKYVVIGFYTSEVGFKALDSPYLTFYAESPGCPHPEEFHSSAAKVSHSA